MPDRFWILIISGAILPNDVENLRLILRNKPVVRLCGMHRSSYIVDTPPLGMLPRCQRRHRIHGWNMLLEVTTKGTQDD